MISTFIIEFWINVKTIQTYFISGGRKNAAILCELLPNASEPEPDNRQQQRGRGRGGNYGGYPDYYGSRGARSGWSKCLPK